jgi:hypothetical protein
MADGMSFKVKNSGSVERHITKILAKSLEDAPKIQYEISLEILSRIATLTPVDTGRATANWKVKLNSPEDRAFPNEFDKSPIPDKTIRKAKNVLKGLKLGDKVFISNNVQAGPEQGGYILGLENGASKQAPFGMVKIAIDTTLVSRL